MNERGGAIIEARSLKKAYGNTTAVDGIDFQIKPGRVTGFLGPNGVGKSTTMRMILGLDLPTAGTVTVDGRGYQGTVWPLHEVGALLDARAVHPGRSAYNHLLSLAAANGIARTRVDALFGRAGPHGPGLQPPDERDGRRSHRRPRCPIRRSIPAPARPGRTRLRDRVRLGGIACAIDAATAGGRPVRGRCSGWRK